MKTVVVMTREEFEGLRTNKPERTNFGDKWKFQGESGAWYIESKLAPPFRILVLSPDHEIFS